MSYDEDDRDDIGEARVQLLAHAFFCMICCIDPHSVPRGWDLCDEGQRLREPCMRMQPCRQCLGKGEFSDEDSPGAMRSFVCSACQGEGETDAAS